MENQYESFVDTADLAEAARLENDSDYKRLSIAPGTRPDGTAYHLFLFGKFRKVSAPEPGWE